MAKREATLNAKSLKIGDGCLYVNKFGIPVCKEKDQCWRISDALMSGTYCHVGDQRYQLCSGKSHPNIPFYNQVAASQKDSIHYGDIVDSVLKHQVTVKDVNFGADNQIACTKLRTPNDKLKKSSNSADKNRGSKITSTKKNERSCNESLPKSKKSKVKHVKGQEEASIRKKLLDKMKNDLLREANAKKLSKTLSQKHSQAHSVSSNEGLMKLPPIHRHIPPSNRSSQSSCNTCSSLNSCSIEEISESVDSNECDSSESSAPSQEDGQTDKPSNDDEDYENEESGEEQKQETSGQQDKQSESECQQNINECLQFMQNLADKQKNVRQAIIDDEPIDHEIMLEECGWRAEIPGNPYNVKKFPRRLPYFVTMPTQSCSERFSEQHYSFYSPFFLNTIPRSRYSYTIDPNFISEHLEGKPPLRPKSYFR